MVSFKLMPNSSLNGSNSFKYSSYCILFSTLALIPSPSVSLHSKSQQAQSTEHSAKRTFKDPHSSWEIINSPRRSQSRRDYRRAGNKIVGKGIVQIALELEDILHSIELVLVPAFPLSQQRIPGSMAMDSLFLPCRAWPELGREHTVQ
jgi:hypothetical protein